MAAAHMQAMYDNTIYSEKASIIPLSLSTYRLLSTTQALLNVLLAKILNTPCHWTFLPKSFLLETTWSPAYNIVS